jgi:WS/DGAT/MGAT family acyltransferase
MLRVEDPVHPNMGTGVILLAEPVDHERLRATIEARLLRFARFRQRVRQPRLPWGHLIWEEDPGFDLDYHLLRLRLPPPGDQHVLEMLVGLLASMPLDLNRPLWQIHQVEDYGPGCALICRVHHSLADGVALMHVLLSLADDDPEAPIPWTEPAHPQQAAPSPHLSPRRGGRRAIVGLARKSLQALAHLEGAAELARRGTSASLALAELLLSPPDSDTVLRGVPGVPKRVAWSAPISLDDVKVIGRRLGGTVNDVLLTAMTGALARYLRDRGEALSGVDLRALIPISLRPAGAEAELGNRIGIVLLPLPVEILDPVERLRALKRRMDDHKDSLEAPLVYGAMQTFGSAPARLIKPAVNYLCARATAVVTNVKGPQQPLYLAGAPLEAFMFWIPRFGGIGVGVSILSYAGTVRVGAISDEEIVPDPEIIIAGFQDELGALLALALEEPPSVKELSARLDNLLTTLDGILDEGTT